MTIYAFKHSLFNSKERTILIKHKEKQNETYRLSLAESLILDFLLKKKVKYLVMMNC